jgi:HEAT repeat protein
MIRALVWCLANHGGGGPPPPPPPPPPPELGAVTGANRAATGGNVSPPGIPGTPGAATGGVRSRGPATARRSPRDEVAVGWEFWWEANRDLHLRSRARREAPATGTTFLTGRTNAAPAPRGVDDPDVRARILPALLQALADGEADVADSAAIALARIVRPGDAALALAPLTRTLDHPAKTAREAAALGLGIVGASEALPILRELLLDSGEGRRLSGRDGGVEERVRAFAAAAMGLIGDPAALDDLVYVLEDPRLGSGRDVPQIALLSIGLLRGAPARTVPVLKSQLERRDVDPQVRAHAPIALASLADAGRAAVEAGAARALLPTLVDLAGARETPEELRRSCAIALGRLGRIEDVEVIDALSRCAALATDPLVRGLSLIALAQIGADAAAPLGHEPELARIETELIGALLDRRRRAQQPVAALALGILADAEDPPRGTRDRAAPKLIELFEESSDPSLRGAVALGLGLMDARAATTALRRCFEETRERTLRGHVALALGMLDDGGMATTLLEELARPGLDPGHATQLGRALGLLGDPRIAPSLGALLREADTFAELAPVAEAVGLAGDRGAIELLLAFLVDRNGAAARRGACAAALGLLCEKGGTRFAAPFLAGSNYCARSGALAEIADIR